MRIINTLFSLFRFQHKSWKAVLLCIVAATVFWFFNALNKTYSTNLNFPVQVDYDEATYIPVTQLPDNVRLNVSGLGWDLFRKSLGLKLQPLHIQLESPAEVRKIPGASLMALFSPQLEGIQLNLVLTDTLHIHMDQRSMRTVGIELDSMEQYLREGYGLSSEILIQPREVMVEGPKSIISAMAVHAIRLPQRRLDRNFNEVIELEWGSPYISSNPPVVTVSFQVDRLMQVTDTIPLKLINIPPEVKGISIRSKVILTYQIPSKLAASVNPDSLHAVLNLHSITRGRSKALPVIHGLSPFSRIEKVDSVDIIF